MSLRVWNKKYPLYHGFCFRVWGVSHKPDTMLLAQPMARQQEAALECPNVFCVASSQNNQKAQTWKDISRQHPCWGSDWVRSVVLNLLSSSSSPAWVSSTDVGGVDSLQRKQNWRKSSGNSPWSSSVHVTDLQLQVLNQLFCYAACQGRSSLQVWFSPLVEGIYTCRCPRCQTLSYSANTEIQT